MNRSTYKTLNCCLTKSTTLMTGSFETTQAEGLGFLFGGNVMRNQEKNGAALLVIDVQRYFFEKEFDGYLAGSQKIVPKINKAIADFKSKGLPVIFTGSTISRAEGALLLAYYGLYLAYLLLGAAGHGAQPVLGAVVLYFVVPLTVLGLGHSASVWIKRRRVGV